MMREGAGTTTPTKSQERTFDSRVRSLLANEVHATSAHWESLNSWGTLKVEHRVFGARYHARTGTADGVWSDMRTSKENTSTAWSVERGLHETDGQVADEHLQANRVSPSDPKNTVMTSDVSLTTRTCAHFRDEPESSEYPATVWLVIWAREVHSGVAHPNVTSLPPQANAPMGTPGVADESVSPTLGSAELEYGIDPEGGT